MRSDVLTSLSTVVRELSTEDDTTRSLELATDAAIELLGADHASIRLCSPDDALELFVRSGVCTDAPPTTYRTGQGILGWVAKEGAIARVGDALGDDRFVADPSAHFDVRSVLAVPVVAGGAVRGVLSMSSPQTDAFESAHEAVSIVLAQCAGQVVRNHELAKRATTDALTGALNRACLVPALDAEINRSRREGKTFSLLSMDLDHFKRVNDRFGHSVGDEVLRVFGKTVRNVVRNFDVLIRRGGEEFVLVMPGALMQDAMLIAERVRLAVAKISLASLDARVRAPTVSIGIATWDGRETGRALDDRADAALYGAKHQGRNRISVASAQPALFN